MRNARMWVRLGVSASICGAVAVAAACGGSSSNDIVTGPDSGSPGPGTDGAPSDGNSGGDVTAEAPYTLDDVCDRLSPVICGLRKDCCTKGPGYDESSCLAHAKAECQKDVAEARAGREEFHPERIPVCIPKYETIFAASCALTVDQSLTYLADIAGCGVFTGKLAEGAVCERDSQCTSAGSPTAITGCDDDTKRCHTTTILAENATCGFGTGLEGLCGAHLFCDGAVNDAGAYAGTCKKRKELTESCTKTAQCGLGNICTPVTSVCAKGKVGGASCQDAFECGSLKCDPTSDAGGAPKTCKPIKPIVKTAECLGP